MLSLRQQIEPFRRQVADLDSRLLTSNELVTFQREKISSLEATIRREREIAASSSEDDPLAQALKEIDERKNLEARRGIERKRPSYRSPAPAARAPLPGSFEAPEYSSRSLSRLYSPIPSPPKKAKTSASSASASGLQALAAAASAAPAYGCTCNGDKAIPCFNCLDSFNF